MLHDRILLFTHNLNFEGAPRSALEIARGAQRAGYQIGVVSDLDGPLRSEYESLGCDVVITPQRIKNGKLCNTRRFYFYLRQVVRSRPALVYANTCLMFPAVWAAKLIRVPTIWCIRESIDPYQQTAAFPPRSHVYMRRTFRMRPHVVFVADATRRQWQRALGTVPTSIIPNGLPAEFTGGETDSGARREIKRSLGLPEACKVVLIVGTTCQRKGQHVFLETACDLLPSVEDKDVHFLVVGARRGAYLNRLRAMIDDANAKDHIHLIDECDDVTQYYQVADICCCCSFEESHPRVVLEAMAFGKPLVATNVWGIPEQVAHEQSALLVPPGDPDALGEAIQRLLDAPYLAEELGNNARQRFQDEFTSDVMMSRYLSLVRGMLNRQEPPAGDADSAGRSPELKGVSKFPLPSGESLGEGEPIVNKTASRTLP